MGRIIKKFTFFLLLIFFCSLTASAESTLKITEIMYDLPGTDTGREWIEVYNAGATDIDLSTYKFFEANTNHGLVPVGNSTLPAGAFAVIADKPENFSVDWPEFSGLIFDSSFSLSNTGEELVLKDADGNVLDQISYSSDLGAVGDEQSLQREGESFIAATPTPGESNASEPPPPPPDDEDPADEEPVDEEPATEDEGEIEEVSGGGSSSSDQAAPKTVKPKTPTFSLKIDLPSHAISNSDFLISAVITGAPENQSAKYVWNFGNADVIETRYNKPFGYIYQFPGTYVITLSYFKDDFAKPIKASAKIIVEENPITISRILPDGSIEIKNSATHQTDLSGWVLKSAISSFVLPAETILMAKSSVIIPAKVTKFYPGLSLIELLFPSGNLAYSSSAGIKLPPPSSLVVRPLSEKNTLSEDVLTEPQIQKTDLSASVINSTDDSQSNSLWPWMLGLGGIIIVSSVISFFIFSGKSASSSDFKLME